MRILHSLAVLGLVANIPLAHAGTRPERSPSQEQTGFEAKLTPLPPEDSSPGKQQQIAGIWIAHIPKPRVSGVAALPPAELEPPDIWFINADGSIKYGPNGDLDVSPVKDPERFVGLVIWEQIGENRVLVADTPEADRRYLYAVKWAANRMIWSGPSGEIRFSFTRLLPGDITPQMRADIARRMKERRIMANLRQLASAADQYYLENGVVSAEFAQLVGPLRLVKDVLSVDGEDYTCIHFRQGEPLSVRTSDGRLFSYNQ